MLHIVCLRSDTPNIVLEVLRKLNNGKERLIL